MGESAATSGLTIAVFGASGRTGRQVATTAVARGLSVRALARRPGSVPGASGIAVIAGELTDTRAVDETLAGCSAACLVFGPRPPYGDVFCAEATRTILEVASRRGVHRIVGQTGAMIGPYPGNRTLPFEAMARAYRRRSPAPHADRLGQEEALRESDALWTILKPPRLTDGPRSDRLRVGPDVRVGLLSKVARADVAAIVLGEMLEPRFVRVAVFMRG